MTPDTVIYDISGTGWSFKDRNSAAWQAGRILQMNQYRVAAGLPAVNPLRLVPPEVTCTNLALADMLHVQVAAGIRVYLVDFSQPAAKLAAWAAELDHDGGLGDLPAGQTIHLIETDAKTEWAAETVADVVRLQASINQLAVEMPIVALDPPVRRDPHTVDRDWHPAAVRRAVETLAAGHVVWTVTLDTSTAVRLARNAGLPGIGTLDGNLFIAPLGDLHRLAQAPTAAEQAERRAAFARGEAERRAEAQAELERLAAGLNHAPHAGQPHAGGSPIGASTSGDVIEALLAEPFGEDAVMFEQARTSEDPAERDRYEFNRFAWTDSDGDLQSGDFGDLIADVERRANYDHSPIVRVYAMTTDAKLEPVGWTVESGEGYGSDDYAYPTLVVTLPDGNKLRRNYRVDGRG